MSLEGRWLLPSTTLLVMNPETRPNTTHATMDMTTAFAREETGARPSIRCFLRLVVTCFDLLTDLLVLVRQRRRRAFRLGGHRVGGFLHGVSCFGGET